MTWRKCVLWLPFVFLLSAILAPFGGISYSATTTTISVDPPMLFVEQGEHFTINLTITGAVDVYFWQANITFDPNVVQFVNATLPPDHFVEGRPEGTTGLLKEAATGSVFLGCGVLGDYAGFHGSGTLVTVEFDVVATGESVLELSDSPPKVTLLFDSSTPPRVTVPGPNLRLEDGYIFNIDHPPTASFTYSPSKPDVNDTITFNASASHDPDGTIVRYEWDFGDGAKINKTVPTTTHVYTIAKTYTVTLTVIDNANATQKIQAAFNTTTMPHLWYELYSSYSADVKFLVDHDIVVVSVNASPTTVTVGKPVTISVTVENDGKNPETFNVTAYYDDTAAATTTVENLASGDNKALELTWDTTGVAPDIYVIKAEAPLEGDENPADNIKEDGTVTVKSSQTAFPMEYVVIGVVGGGAAIGIGVFLFLRRRRAPAT